MFVSSTNSPAQNNIPFALYNTTRARNTPWVLVFLYLSVSAHWDNGKTTHVKSGNYTREVCHLHTWSWATLHVKFFVGTRVLCPDTVLHWFSCSYNLPAKTGVQKSKDTADATSVCKLKFLFLCLLTTCICILFVSENNGIILPKVLRTLFVRLRKIS